MGGVASRRHSYSVLEAFGGFRTVEVPYRLDATVPWGELVWYEWKQGVVGIPPEGVPGEWDGPVPLDV